MKKTVLSVALVASALLSNAQSNNAYSAHKYVSVAGITDVQSVTSGTALNVPGIQTFSIAATGYRVKLEWNAVKEESIDRYEVERSADGIHFERAVATFTAGLGSYATTDAGVQAGLNYYRVRTVTTSGDEKFSPTREVRLAQPATERTVYPTDNRNGLVYILLNPDTEDVVFTVVNTAGVAVRVPASRDGRQYVANLQGLPAGMYSIIVDAAGTRSAHRVMYQP